MKYKFLTQQSRLTHCTNAEELIAKVPVVEVDDDVVLCYVKLI